MRREHVTGDIGHLPAEDVEKLRAACAKAQGASPYKVEHIEAVVYSSDKLNRGRIDLVVHFRVGIRRPTIMASFYDAAAALAGLDATAAAWIYG